MKSFLAVNIGALDLSVITNLLEEHTSEFKILTSKKLREIDDIVKTLNPDFVIIDLITPSPKDLKTLNAFSKSHPRLPLLILTALETGEIKSAIKSIGSARHFEKPVDFKKVVDTIWAKIERSVGGQIQGISLTSFLQMSEMEKTSCTLTIKTDKKSGTIYLLKGGLIAAEAGELKNEEAVFDILTWENPSIEIDDKPTDRKKEIEAPLISILMESAQRKDDKRAKKTPPPKKAPGQKTSKKTPAKKGKKGEPAAGEPAPGEAAEAPPPEPEVIPEKIRELLDAGVITDAGKILKRKRLITQASRVLAAALALVIILCLWQYAVNPWLAKTMFNKAIANANAAQSIQEKVLILDKYLSSRPKPQYAAQAEKMKDSFAGEVEKQAFERVVRAVTGLPLDDSFLETAKAAYQKFLEEFPDSPHKDEIKQRIETLPSILANTEYAKLIDIPENHYTQRLKAYKSFLAKYPDSTHTANVKERMSSLGQALYEYIKKKKASCDNEKNWQHCLKLCQYFCDNFQGHARYGDITALQRDINARAAYVKIAEQLEKAGNFSEKTRPILEGYLEKYPDSPHRGEVEAKLADIYRNKNKEVVWQQLLEYVKDNRNSIFDRTDRMRDYLDRQPADNHRGDAESIYAWLIKEREKAQQHMNQQAASEKARQQNKSLIGQETKRVISQLQRSGGRFSVVGQDAFTDNQTGLTWCLLDSSVLLNRCVDYKSAKRYVESLNNRGYSDWRLPDPGELLVLYNSRSDFPVSQAAFYWTSEDFYTAWTKKDNTVLRTSTGTWIKTETDMGKCGAVRAVRP